MLSVVVALCSVRRQSSKSNSFTLRVYRLPFHHDIRYANDLRQGSCRSACECAAVLWLSSTMAVGGTRARVWNITVRYYIRNFFSVFLRTYVCYKIQTVKFASSFKKIILNCSVTRNKIIRNNVRQFWEDSIILLPLRSSEYCIL